MAYSFNSVLADEFRDYIDLRRASGACIKHTLSHLSSLDRYLVERNISDKNLPEKIFTQWLAPKCVGSRTKSGMICTMSVFSKYMRSMGYTISVPEPPRISSDYTPRLLSKEEFTRIFVAADNFKYRRRSAKSSVQFPILLRILYGCGLRLKEAVLLAWRDVDLDNGILTIYHAKNKKQRFVPMSNSLTEILRLYRKDTELNNIAGGLVFESRYGKPYAVNTITSWFSQIIKAAGIEHTRTRKHERGLCLHCFRHQFVLDSFLKSESEGHSFEEMVPFLSAYLGHRDILGTEKYLSSSYELYTDAHETISDYINDVFPEVTCDG